MRHENEHREVTIPVDSVALAGTLSIRPDARGVVLFAHGSGSSRHSPRNRFVADVLRDAGMDTLLMDLLTEEEEQIDLETRHLRFDIGLLAERLVEAADWLAETPATSELPIGYFGSSTGAGAALVAAAERPDVVAAVVSRGGRPDLAGPALPRVEAPTLLIVGSRDFEVIRLNRYAMASMRAETKLELVEGATHLFEEPGTLGSVAELAGKWFTRHLSGASTGPRAAPGTR
jgi:dienelactone hydrolase